MRRYARRSQIQPGATKKLALCPAGSKPGWWDLTQTGQRGDGNLHQEQEWSPRGWGFGRETHKNPSAALTLLQDEMRIGGGMLKRPRNLPAPQWVVLQGGSAGKTCRARYIWALFFFFPCHPPISFRSRCSSPWLWMQIQLFMWCKHSIFFGCQGLCVTCRLGSVCILDHKGTENAAQNVYGIFRPRQICSTLRAPQSEHPGEAG